LKVLLATQPAQIPKAITSAVDTFLGRCRSPN
jgi:hypothetical protein